MTDFYRRNLPHHQPDHATYHIVFRLAGSLPQEALQRLQNEVDESERYASGMKDEKMRFELFHQIRQEYFEKFDSLLDGYSTGPHWLREPQIAELIVDALHFRDKKLYDLIAFTVMPNHVHTIFSIGEAKQIDKLHHVGRRVSSPYVVTRILENLKWYTALKANKLLHREGQFWQHESYDHVIRNGEEFEKAIWYVLNNPVKAALAKTWDEWKWSYVKQGLI